MFDFVSVMEEVRFIPHLLCRVSTNVYCASAGQVGLVGALASAYIDWSRQFGGVTEDYLVRLEILCRLYDEQVSIALDRLGYW
jgi:hypothetical protein